MNNSFTDTPSIPAPPSVDAPDSNPYAPPKSQVEAPQTIKSGVRLGCFHSILGAVVSIGAFYFLAGILRPGNAPFGLLTWMIAVCGGGVAMFVAASGLRPLIRRERRSLLTEVIATSLLIFFAPLISLTMVYLFLFILPR